MKAWELVNRVIDAVNPPSEFTKYGFTVKIDVKQELTKYLVTVPPQKLRELLLSVKALLVDYNG